MVPSTIHVTQKPCKIHSPSKQLFTILKNNAALTFKKQNKFSVLKNPLTFKRNYKKTLAFSIFNWCPKAKNAVNVKIRNRFPATLRKLYDKKIHNQHPNTELFFCIHKCILSSNYYLIVIFKRHTHIHTHLTCTPWF